MALAGPAGWTRWSARINNPDAEVCNPAYGVKTGPYPEKSNQEAAHATQPTVSLRRPHGHDGANASKEHKKEQLDKRHRGIRLQNLIRSAGRTSKQSFYCYNASLRYPPNMKDLSNPAWIKAKGLLFLFLGLLSASLLFCEHPTPRAALLLILAVWCFCRFYYFAFYVIERYVDPNYRFSGLLSFARYLFRKQRQKP